MTGYLVGMEPTRVFTPTEIVQGKAPGKGSVGTTHDGKVFRMVEIVAGPVVRGQIVALAADNYAAITTAATAGVPNVGPLAVAVNTATASASAHIWVQVYGPGAVLFDVTTSASPGAAIKLGADGKVTAAAVTTASAYISGLTVLTTVSVTGSGSVFINYPRAISG